MRHDILPMDRALGRFASSRLGVVATFPVTPKNPYNPRNNPRTNPRNNPAPPSGPFPTRVMALAQGGAWR